MFCPKICIYAAHFFKKVEIHKYLIVKQYILLPRMKKSQHFFLKTAHLSCQVEEKWQKWKVIGDYALQIIWKFSNNNVKNMRDAARKDKRYHIFSYISLRKKSVYLPYFFRLKNNYVWIKNSWIFPLSLISIVRFWKVCIWLLLQKLS